MTGAEGTLGRVGELLDGLECPTVLAAMTPQLPVALVRALLAQARRRDLPVNLLVADLTGRFDFLTPADEQALADGRLTVTVIAGAVPARLADAVEHLPVSLWEADRLVAAGALGIDVFLATVGRCPDGAGSHGQMVGYTPAALATVGRVAFEVVPVTRAQPGAELELSRADLLLDAAPVPRAAAPGLPSLAQRRVAELTAALIPDGATLQLGLGTAPAHVARLLGSHHDLGFHSGVLPGAVQELLAGGAVTGSRKSHDRGRHVATGTLGGDPDGWSSSVTLRPLSYTHDPRVLFGHRRLWAVNSAFQVDLRGQVNAEYVLGRKRASGGGQSDFARAAHAGDGASVICLSSRARDGSPRLVPRLDCPVTTPGGDVDYVVTEYGVAALAGRTSSQRAAALVGIAHPDDRAALSHQLPGYPLRSTG